MVSIDAAGNRSAETRYDFWVRYTAPYAEVDVAGVGLPSKITLTASTDKVTGYGYQVTGAAEVRVPAVDGVGTGQITFPTTGTFEVTVRTYNGTKMIGSDVVNVYVTDAPGVHSDEFSFEHEDAVAGATGSFRFTPRTTGVVAYVYDFNDGTGQQRVDAAADGSATLPWTATAGWFYLTVQSERADGTLSETADYQFNVVDPVPTAYADIFSWPRRDGVGLPLQIGFNSWLPDVTGFAYRFDGGAEHTVGLGEAATVTPTHAGETTIVVQALRADGTRSPQGTHTFNVWSGPLVSWTPEGKGTLGEPVTFTFRPALSGVAEYRYSLDGEDEQTVAAGADGTATVTLTPNRPGLSTLNVTSVGADGATSDTRQQYFEVRDTRVHVSSFYGHTPQGGIGASADFMFYSDLHPDVVSYRYRVDDAPERTVAAGRATRTHGCPSRSPATGPARSSCVPNWPPAS
ncbi:hypothetical protein ACFQX7_22760 [Luedemannella flava]